MDSSASKHMTGFKHNLVNYRDKKFNVKVELSDDGTYDIKGFGPASFQLQSDNVFHIDEILYVPGLKKNHISVAMWPSGSYILNSLHQREGSHVALKWGFELYHDYRNSSEWTLQNHR